VPFPEFCPVLAHGRAQRAGVAHPGPFHGVRQPPYGVVVLVHGQHPREHRARIGCGFRQNGVPDRDAADAQGHGNRFPR